MLQILYKSVATVPFSSAELARLLMKSRVQNDLFDVTGILVYHEGSFLHVLEGPETAVLGTYGRIADDPRHKCLQVMLHRTIEERTFPEWSMGFVCTYGNWAKEMPGFEEFFDRKGTYNREAGEKLLRLLQQFRFNPSRRKVDLGYAPLFAR